jgi:hypothetical protein
MDMKARWYDPLTAGFLTADTYPGTLTAPYTQNRYAYVGNNPINMWDPTGHVPEWVRGKSDHVEYYGDHIDSFWWKKWTYQSYSSSYSVSWLAGSSQDNRNIYETWAQYVYETWNYHYRFSRTIFDENDEIIDIVDGNWPVIYNETRLYTWTNIISAADIANENREMLRSYGPPPANAKPVFSVGSVNGEITSAEILIDESTFTSFSSVQQQIIADSVFEMIGVNTKVIDVQREVQMMEDGKSGYIKASQVQVASSQSNTPGSSPAFGTPEFGTAVHKLIQEHFRFETGGRGRINYKIPGVGDSYGIADMVLQLSYYTEVYEAKPITYWNDPIRNAAGKQQLEGYINALINNGDNAIEGVEWNPNGDVLIHPYDINKELVLETHYESDPGMIYYYERYKKTQEDSVVVTKPSEEKEGILSKLFNKIKDVISDIADWEYYPNDVVPGPFGPPIPDNKGNNGGWGIPIPRKGIPIW